MDQGAKKTSIRQEELSQLNSKSGPWRIEVVPESTRRTYAEVVKAAPSASLPRTVPASENITKKTLVSTHPVLKFKNLSNLKGIKSKKGTTYSLTSRHKIKSKSTKKKVTVLPTATSSRMSLEPDPISSIPPFKSASPKIDYTPAVTARPSDPIDNIMNWMFGPENSSTACLTQDVTVESKTEPVDQSKTPVQETSLVQQWLDQYIDPQPRDTTTVIDEIDPTGPRKETIACPRCSRHVKRIGDHLSRTCMTDAQGHTAEERKLFMKQILSPRADKKNSVVRVSEINNSLFFQGTTYVDYMIHLFERCGVLIHRDVAAFSNMINLAPPSLRSWSTQTLPVKEEQLGIAPHLQEQRSTQTSPQEQHQGSTQTSSRLQHRRSTQTSPTLQDQRSTQTSPVPCQSLVKPYSENACTRESINGSPASLIQESSPATSVKDSSSSATSPATSVKDSSSSATSPQRGANIIVDVKNCKLRPFVLIERLPTKRKLDLLNIEIPEVKKCKSEDISPGSGSTISVKAQKNYTKKDINVKMSRLGFYNKFDIGSCPILQQFHAHLQNTLYIPKSLYRNQIVANVNRILFHLYPTSENPDCLANTEAITKYFNLLPSQLVASTKANYIKSLFSFLSFCSQTTSVRTRYPTLIKALPTIRECLSSIQTGLSKLTSRRLAERRAAQFRGENQPVSIDDILKLVEELKQRSIKYLDVDSHLSVENLKRLNTYFNALITLKNAHRPSVFVNMTLNEFEKPVKIKMDNGEVKLSVGVVEHKTARTQLATVSFSESEYESIQQYITKVRDRLANSNSPNNVFLNSNGRKICNASSDLRTTQIHLGLPLITSTQARHSYETKSSELLQPDQRVELANYLAHTVGTANVNYVEITEGKIKGMVSAMAILQDPQSWTNRPVLQNDSTETTSSSATDPDTSTKPAIVKVDTKLDQNPIIYKSILEQVKITVDMEIPSSLDIKLIAQEIKGGSSLNATDFKRIRGRLDYERMSKRASNVVSNFPFMRPSKDEISQYLTQKGWYNLHTNAMVEKTWNPGHNAHSALDLNIQKLLQSRINSKIASQKWHSCSINQGVLHSKRFILKGELVCDYHAEAISHEEGMSRYDSCVDHSYRQRMFFFTFRDTQYCIDGNKPCICHQMPSDQIKGRMLEHSIQSANVISKVPLSTEEPDCNVEQNKSTSGTLSLKLIKVTGATLVSEPTNSSLAASPPNVAVNLPPLPSLTAFPLEPLKKTHKKANETFVSFKTSKANNLSRKETILPGSSKVKAVCPHCYKRVGSLKRHLRRTCLRKDYNQTQRLIFKAQEEARYQTWRQALVLESDLYREGVIGQDNVGYVKINYVLDLFKKNGILVYKDLTTQHSLNAPKLTVSPSSAGGSVSPVAGPSGITDVSRKGQLFEDDEEENPTFHMEFNEGTVEAAEPIVTVRESPRKRTMSSSSDDSDGNLPLSKIKRLIEIESVSVSRPMNYNKSIYVSMKKRGLYAKFKLDVCPVLTKFKEYVLENTKSNTTSYINQVVGNVNRLLHFLHPTGEKVEALCDSSHIRLFFEKIPMEMASSSKLNYIKSLKLFIDFLEKSPEMLVSHPSLIPNLNSIRSTLASIRSEIACQGDKMSSKSSTSIKVVDVVQPASKPDKTLLEALYKSICDNLEISIDQDLPSFEQVRLATSETHPGVTLDYLSIKRIRNRLSYERHALRVANVIASFPRVLPAENKITEFLKTKGWYTRRAVSDIIQKWTPSERRVMGVNRQAEEEKKWIECIDKQSWKSCVVRSHDDPKIGKAVYAKEDIQKGQVVCDYHGDLISHTEGLKRYDAYPADINHYMMFFEFQGTKYCIDGNIFCSCHHLSKDQTKGRLVNHSKSHPNLIPKPQMLNGKPHVLLRAMVDIPLGAELTFDYGVSNDPMSREDGENSFLEK